MLADDKREVVAFLKKASIELEWRLHISLPQAVWAEAQRLMAESDEDTELCIRLKMAMSRYQKQSPTPD